MDSTECEASTSGRGHHWSYSKSADFEACPLKIYFRGEGSGDASQSDEVILSPVNLNAIVGIAVHRGIASQMDEWAAGGTPTFQGAKHTAENWIEEIWRDRYERIIEANNGKHLSSGQRHKFIGIAKRHLRTFSKAIWPEYRHHEHVLHEELQTFAVRGNTIQVKVDLCTRDQDGNLVITDWKTSAPPLLEFDSLQLDVYGLWAREDIEPDVDNIKIKLGHTRTGDTSLQSLTPEHLEDVAELIDLECQEWNSKDGIEDYTADPESQKCRECQYLKGCDAGQIATK
jgi:hypothetical protein